jgi:hypothetical protein
MGQMDNIEAEGGAELRTSRRTNLMLAATIEAGGRTAAVRIRNLSETEALIEGAGLPEKGEALVVSRGALAISATVAWSGGGKCGVRFGRPTPVSEWTGGKPRPLECTGLRDQRRVDAIQADARSQAGAEPLPAASAPAALPEQLEKRLADELAYVQRLIESMGDELVSEPIVVRHHARALQKVDIASQILGYLAAIIVADDRAAAVEAVGMEDLRARPKRKPWAETVCRR